MKVPTKNFAGDCQQMLSISLSCLTLASYCCALVLIISAVCGHIVDPVHAQDYRCMGMAGVVQTLLTALCYELYTAYTKKRSVRPSDAGDQKAKAE